MFEENKLYNLNLNYTESSIMFGFLTVKSYNRLYKEYSDFKADIANEDLELQGAGKTLHYTGAFNRLKKEDEILDSIMMNQLALGLLLEKYIQYCLGHKKEEIRTLKLSPILIYELYVTVSERIISERNDYNSKEGAHNTTREELDTIKNRIRVLEILSDRIFKLISLENLELMSSEYNKLSIEEHLNFCLKEL